MPLNNSPHQSSPHLNSNSPHTSLNSPHQSQNSPNSNALQPSANGPNSYLPLNRDTMMKTSDDKSLNNQKRPQEGIPIITPLEPSQLPKSPSNDYNRRPNYNENYPKRDDFYETRKSDEKSPSNYQPPRPFDVASYENRFNRDGNQVQGDEKYMLRSQEQNYGQQWNNWGKKSRQNEYNYEWGY